MRNFSVFRGIVYYYTYYHEYVKDNNQQWIAKIRWIINDMFNDNGKIAKTIDLV